MKTMHFSPARLYIAVILAGQSMANMDTAIINVATPSIGATLHATGAQLQLTVTVYVLATATLLVTAARLGALYGYRRVFLIGLVTFTLASLGCGLAPDVMSLIVARIAQGVGAALMVAQVISGIQRTLTGAARTRAIGAYTITLSLSAVAGQILGGVLISADIAHLAWRPLFLINIPIGIALFALALRVMPPDEAPAGARPRLDWIGVALFALTMLLLILPLTIGREMQWPWWTVAALIACVPAGALFVAWQRRLGDAGRGPLLNLELFREPGIVPLIVGQSCARMCYFALLFTLALYVQKRARRERADIGTCCCSRGWPHTASPAPSIHACRRTYRRRSAESAADAIMAAAFAGAALTTVSHAYGHVVRTDPCVSDCGGFGFGLLSTAVTAQLTSECFTKDRAPDLSGVLSTMTPLSAILRHRDLRQRLSRVRRPRRRRCGQPAHSRS